MGVLKLKKMKWQRRRFLKSAPITDLSSWMDVDASLRQRLLTESTFQLVGGKSILEISAQNQSASLLLEVLGVPTPSFLTVDLMPLEVLVLECPEESFKIDFEAVMGRARQVMNGAVQPISETFHLVIEGAKLELHFFRQKDYSQTAHLQ